MESLFYGIGLQEQRLYPLKNILNIFLILWIKKKMGKSHKNSIFLFNFYLLSFILILL